MRGEDEFHFHRTLYFLKKVKDSVSPFLWKWLEMKHAHLLDTTLGTTRGVFPWRAIDRANLPKLYGITKIDDVLWSSDVDEVIACFHNKTFYKFTNPSDTNYNQRHDDDVVLVRIPAIHGDADDSLTHGGGGAGTGLLGSDVVSVATFWVGLSTFLFLNSLDPPPKWHGALKKWFRNNVVVSS